MKYIIVKQGKLELSVVFSEFLQHIDIARTFLLDTRSSIVAAGFCYIEEKRVACWGESKSIKMATRGLEPYQSRGEVDADIIIDDIESP